MAIGWFALGSNKSLGVAKWKAQLWIKRGDDKTGTSEGSKATYVLTSNGGGKHMRSYFSEDEILLMMTKMNDVVNNVANALRETRPARCWPIPCCQWTCLGSQRRPSSWPSPNCRTTSPNLRGLWTWWIAIGFFGLEPSRPRTTTCRLFAYMARKMGMQLRVWFFHPPWPLSISNFWVLMLVASCAAR